MPLSLYRLRGPKMVDLHLRERDALRLLVAQAELGSADPRALLQEATSRLQRRIINQLIDELHEGGVERLREIQFRHTGLDGYIRAPVAAVAAFAWLRSAERILETGMEPEALAVLVAVFPARDEAEHAPSA